MDVHEPASTKQVAAEQIQEIEPLLESLRASPEWVINPTARSRIEASVSALLSTLRSGSSGEAASGREAEKKADALYRDLDDAVAAVLASLHEKTLIHANDVDEAVDYAGTVLILLTLLVLTVTASLLWRFSRRVIRPLDELREALERLSQGDLNVDIRYQYRQDEIGRLARACTAFRQSLVARSQAEEARIRAEVEREYIAQHDPLTSLPNASRFTALLGAAVSRAVASASIHVLVISIDGIRSFTELHGAASGDELVREIARRLRAESPHDVTARLESSLFAVFSFGSRGSTAGASRLAKRLIEKLDGPVNLGEVGAELRARIGISSYPADAQSAGELVRLAELALSRGEDSARVTFFEARMDRELRLEAALEADVKAAVAQEAIEPWFQPVVETATGTIFGVEMLARWRREDNEIVGPGQFIPVVDRLGLMN